MPLTKIVQIRVIAVISAAALVVTLAVPEAAFARRGEKSGDDDRRGRSYVRVDDNGHGRNRGPGNNERCSISSYHSKSERRGKSSNDGSYNHTTHQSRERDRTRHRSGDDGRRYHSEHRGKNVTDYRSDRDNNRVECRSNNSSRGDNRNGRHGSGRQYANDSYSGRHGDDSQGDRHYNDEYDDNSYSGGDYDDNSNSGRYYDDRSRSGRR